MKRNCPHCNNPHTECSTHGSYIRKSDHKRIMRFRCYRCKLTFSQATTQSCYRQKKRKLNPRISELLVSGVSQRRVAKLLKISRTTVVRKFLFLGTQAREKNQSDFNKLDEVFHMQFDDLETFEHTKCKPLSVVIAIERKSRRILGFKVAQMPAKGPLAKIARKKYGYRPDFRKLAREELFSKLTEKVAPDARIDSDQSPLYPATVQKYFPKCIHKTTKGQRGCITGQGELKKTSYDPLFDLNHSFAMLRANINRLFRKTWCTTKKKERLEAHLELYVLYHNRVLI